MLNQPSLLSISLLSNAMFHTYHLYHPPEPSVLSTTTFASDRFTPHLSFFSHLCRPTERPNAPLTLSTSEKDNKFSGYLLHFLHLHFHPPEHFNSVSVIGQKKILFIISSPFLPSIHEIGEDEVSMVQEKSKIPWLKDNNINHYSPIVSFQSSPETT